MKKYKVKLDFIYSDTVYVEAEDEKNAIEKALDECEEVWTCFHDAEVTEDFTNEG